MCKEPVFNLTGHRDMWDWLSKNPTKMKWHWPGWVENGGTYEHCESNCFACNYVLRKMGKNVLSHCGEYCPLTGWEARSDARIPCVAHNGLYDRWVWNDDAESRAEIAAKIRDLPVREGVEYE